MERVVLCMKWGTLYPARYVNVLHRAVRAHLEGPFRFVCFTDDAAGFDSDIEARPLPDLALPPERFGHGAWPKLGVFSDDLENLSGRALFIDLDTIITGNLQPFFDLPGKFIAISGGKEWRRARTVTNPKLLSGIFAFDIGSLGFIVDRFVADPEAAFSQYENEQSFIEGVIGDWSGWPDGWVISFKRHLRQPLGLDLLFPPRTPGNAKIVAFHGDPRPIDLVGRKGLWSDAPHFVRCPVNRLDDYWSRYDDSAGQG